VRPVLVLNGPNLGRLGSREPDVYGTVDFAGLAEECRATGRELGLRVEVRQTDDEAELIGWVHEAADQRVPVVLNPAAFTHYSYALRDALAMRTAPLIEVHISNPACCPTGSHCGPSRNSAPRRGTPAEAGRRRRDGLRLPSTHHGKTILAGRGLAAEGGSTCASGCR